MRNPKSKRILYLVQLPPPLHGVSLMNRQLLGSTLIRRQFEADIINFQFAGSVGKIGRFSFLKIFKALLYAFRIAAKALSVKPDLVYFTIAPAGFAFYRDALYVLLLKAFRLKIILHLHGQGVKAGAGKSRFNRWLYRRVFKKAKVVCLSEKLTADLEGVYKGIPYIVPNGIGEQILNDPASVKRGYQASQIFYLSNFFTSKGILVLLEALRILKKQGFAFEARLAGAPGDLSLAYVEDRIAALELEDRAVLLGPVYGDEKFKALLAADIFVHPTYFDAFPLVILEAMQCRLPVVSTFEGGIPDMVQDGVTGFLVEAQNAEELAKKTGFLLEDAALRENMGRAGYEHYRNTFTMRQFEENMARLFQKVLSMESTPKPRQKRTIAGR